jgi:hypothetical protein
MVEVRSKEDFRIGSAGGHVYKICKSQGKASLKEPKRSRRTLLLLGKSFFDSSTKKKLLA